MGLTLYYASDVHGSEVAWRKFLNAGRHYRADVLVMGGDIAGKAIVPFVAGARGLACPPDHRRARHRRGRVARGRAPRPRPRPLPAPHDRGGGSRRSRADPAALEALFAERMRAVLQGWVELARERLAGTGIAVWIMLGNDDPPELAEVIAARRPGR